MVCGGPNRNHSYKIGEDAFEEILVLLQEKYQVDLSDTRIEGQKKMAGSKLICPVLIECRNDLKKAIQEAIWTDHVANF